MKQWRLTFTSSGAEMWSTYPGQPTRGVGEREPSLSGEQRSLHESLKFRESSEPLVRIFISHT